MAAKKKLPIGIDSFEKIITNGFYYADKTMLIKELLLNWGEVNLFTRPRRFGKSLNMSMLQHFFQIGCDKKMFDGLKVSKETALCEEYMGQFPVISITLKDVDGLNFEIACKRLKEVIGTEAECFSFLLESSRLTKNEKEKYLALTDLNNGCYTMDEVVLASGLKTLSMLLGLLQYEDSWFIKSNMESGEGFSDILLETQNRTGVVIEVRYAEDGNLDRWCGEALAQIERNNYAARLVDDGMKTIVKYGIAFYKKHCRAVLG